MKALPLPGFNTSERSQSQHFSNPEMRGIVVDRRGQLVNAENLLSEAIKQAMAALSAMEATKIVLPLAPETDPANQQELEIRREPAEAPIDDFIKKDANLLSIQEPTDQEIRDFVEELTPDSARRGVAAALEEGELKK